jgi:type II secretory pathway component PulK
MLLVLVIIVLSISSVGAFARRATLEVTGMRHRADRGRAELLARSGVAVAVRALKDDLIRAADSGSIESPRDPWYLIGERAVEVPDQGLLRIRVRDMGAKINLNGLVDEKGVAHPESHEFLSAALRYVKGKMRSRKEDVRFKPKDLAGAILDWMDADVRTRVGDFEARAYRRAGARVRPSNRPFFSVNELGALPHVDTEVLEALRHYFTVHPIYADIGEAGVNPNTAPGWTLGLIYMGTAQRRELIEYREVLATLQERAQGRIFCPVSDEEPCTSFHELIGQVGETAFPPLAFHNRAFEVESVAKYRAASACVTSVIERRGPEDVQPIAYEPRCR